MISAKSHSRLVTSSRCRHRRATVKTKNMYPPTTLIKLVPTRGPKDRALSPDLTPLSISHNGHKATMRPRKPRANGARTLCSYPGESRYCPGQTRCSHELWDPFREGRGRMIGLRGSAVLGKLPSRLHQNFQDKLQVITYVHPKPICLDLNAVANST